MLTVASLRRNAFVVLESLDPLVVQFETLVDIGLGWNR